MGWIGAAQARLKIDRNCRPMAVAHRVLGTLVRLWVWMGGRDYRQTEQKATSLAENALLPR